MMVDYGDSDVCTGCGNSYLPIDIEECLLCGEQHCSNCFSYHVQGHEED